MIFASYDSIEICARIPPTLYFMLYVIIEYAELGSFYQLWVCPIFIDISYISYIYLYIYIIHITYIKYILCSISYLYGYYIYASNFWHVTAGRPNSWPNLPGVFKAVPSKPSNLISGMMSAGRPVAKKGRSEGEKVQKITEPREGEGCLSIISNI